MVASASSVTCSLIAEVNTAHRAFLSACASAAVTHAIRCGELLLQQKADLRRGEFVRWLSTNCEFPQSTAYRYMKAADEFSHGREIQSLRSLFPSGHRKAASANEELPAPADESVTVPPVAGTETASSEITFETAFRLLKSDAEYARRYRNIIRERTVAKKEITALRRQLERAEIAERNAAATIMAAGAGIDCGSGPDVPGGQ